MDMQHKYPMFRYKTSSTQNFRDTLLLSFSMHQHNAESILSRSVVM